MTEYRCMTSDELALWVEQAESFRRKSRGGSRRPCTDCPAWFAASAGDLCINRTAPVPGPTGYVLDDRRREARRKTWRDSKRRARERGTGVRNHGLSGKIDAAGVSGNHDSATMRTARSSVLTPPETAPFVSPGVRR